MIRVVCLVCVLACPVVAVEPTGAISFTNDVMAVLGKAGCNSGACHGHNSGKAGFKLSLRGYDLRADFAALADADSGRVDRKDPADSLILQMPTAQLEHGGGEAVRSRFGVLSGPVGMDSAGGEIRCRNRNETQADRRPSVGF